MKPKSMKQDILTFLLRALVFSPVAGIFCGFIVASIGFTISGYIYNPGFIFSYAVAFGVPIGLLFGILVFWSLRKHSLSVIGKYLMGGTLVFGMPFALIPNIGVPLSWFAGMFGFWIGYIFLKQNLLKQLAKYFSRTEIIKKTKL